MENKTESMKGGLWLTAMGRIVLDDHNNEVYAEPSDIKLMTKEELTNGIWFARFSVRLSEAQAKQKIQSLSNGDTN